MNLDELLGETQVAKTAINHTAAVNEIMNCEDLVRLAGIQVGLERRVGQLDVAMVTETGGKELAAGRAEKRVAIALMDLARQRSKALKDTTARLNHNFRQISADVLPASMYEAIEKEARLPLKR